METTVYTNRQRVRDVRQRQGQPYPYDQVQGMEQEPGSETSQASGLGGPLLMFSLCATALLIMLAWAVRSSSENLLPSLTRNTGHSAGESASAAEQSSTVQLNITAEPASAVLSLDGRVLDANPYRTRLPRDSREHTLTVSARGYLSVTKTVKLDSDLTLTLQLEKRSKSAGRTTLANVQRDEHARRALELDSESEAANSYVELPGAKHAHKIDKADPWARSGIETR
jgi:hypothetical protein